MQLLFVVFVHFSLFTVQCSPFIYSSLFSHFLSAPSSHNKILINRQTCYFKKKNHSLCRFKMRKGIIFFFLPFIVLVSYFILLRFVRTLYTAQQSRFPSVHRTHTLCNFIHCYFFLASFAFTLANSPLFSISCSYTQTNRHTGTSYSEIVNFYCYYIPYIQPFDGLMLQISIVFVMFFFSTHFIHGTILAKRISYGFILFYTDLIFEIYTLCAYRTIFFVV